MSPVPDFTVAGQLAARASPQRVNYPNRIFSLSDHYTPSSPKELFRYCKYYFLTHGPLQQAILRASRYPITQLQFETEDADLEKTYRELFYRHWKIRSLLTEVGVYRKVFGNCFVSVNVLPQRYVKCERCSTYTRAENFMRQEAFRWKDFQFHGRCRTCGHTGIHLVHDVRPRRPEFVRLTIWDPANIDIDYNPATGESFYYYSLPNRLKARIVAGHINVLATTPRLFIQAAKEGRRIRLNQRHLFHFLRPGLAPTHGGWGMPAPMPALQELFHRGTLRRAQEALATEHIVPLRVLFPESNTDQPAQLQYDLSSFRKQVEAQLEAWKRDPNHIAVVPYPLGLEDFSGKGKAFMVTPEIAQADQAAVVGAGYPVEFVWGGLSYSGSSVSLRMLENDFLNERADIEDFFDFVISTVAPFLKLSPVPVRLSEFKMADDQFLRDYKLKLNLMGKVSDSSMLADVGLESDVEQRKIRQELRENFPVKLLQSRLEARAQGEAQMEMANVEARIRERLMQDDPALAGVADAGGAGSGGLAARLGAGQGSGQPGQAAATAGQAGGGSYVDLPSMAWAHAHQLGQLDPGTRQLTLQRMRQEMPAYHSIVAAILNDDADPLPEQRPPRRRGAAI